MNTAFPTLQLHAPCFLQRRGRRRWSGLGLLPTHVLERTAQVPLALLAVALVVQDLVLAAGYLLNGAAARTCGGDGPPKKI